MKKNIKSNRFTIELSDENKDSLEYTKEYMFKPYGNIVNDVLSFALSCPEEMQQDLLIFCKKKLTELYDKINIVSPYEKEKISTQIDKYNLIIPYLNKGVPISMDNLLAEKSNLKSYDFEGGRLIVPEDWIILNPEEARQSWNALVVECRQNLKGVEIPHFVYYHNMNDKQVNTISSYMDEVNRLCCQKWKKFNDVVALQVELLFDPITHTPLNDAEVAASPQIGYFIIPVLGEKKHRKQQELPYGACIIRPEMAERS